MLTGRLPCCTGGPQRFQIQPLVLQLSPEQQPSLYTIPRQYYGEVPLVHPNHSWFAGLGLKWYSTPAVANMELSVGGIKYTGVHSVPHVTMQRYWILQYLKSLQCLQLLIGCRGGLLHSCLVCAFLLLTHQTWCWMSCEHPMQPVQHECALMCTLKLVS